MYTLGIGFFYDGSNQSFSEINGGLYIKAKGMELFLVLTPHIWKDGYF